VTDEPTRYTFIGAGGIGGSLGTWMARAGCDVTFVDRWQEHVDAINTDGVRVEGSRGRHVVRVPAITPERLADRAPLDIVVVAVKAQDTHAALEQCLPFSTPKTAFVSMQAGMNLWTFEEVAGRSRAIGADPNYGAVIVGPGRLETGFPNYIIIGELDGAFTPRLRRLRRDFTHWTPTVMTDNVVGTVWSKFVYGSQIMTTAVTDRPPGEALGPRAHRLVAAAMVREAMRVSDALGIALEPFDFFDPEPYRVERAGGVDGLGFWIECAWPRHEVFRAHGNHPYALTGSIWRWDIVAQHRKSEASVFTDTLREAARRAGVAIPLNEGLLHVFEEIEAGRRPMTDDNVGELARLIDREGQSLS
jgi:2-dehydropantoate 2-reductase